MRVVAAASGQVVEAEAIVGLGVFPPPGLEQAGDVFRGVLPPVGALGIVRLRRPVLQVVAEGLVGGHRRLEIARQDVVEQAVVGGSLHVRLSPQGVHATPGQADIPQQQLQGAVGADVLGAVGVLGGAHGVEPGAHAVGRPGGGVDLADSAVGLPVRPGDVAYCVDVVAGEVPLHELVHAAGVFQGAVLPGHAAAVQLKGPGRLIVLARLRIVAREQSVVERKPRIDDERGVGVVSDVLLLDEVVL